MTHEDMLIQRIEALSAKLEEWETRGAVLLDVIDIATQKRVDAEVKLEEVQAERDKLKHELREIRAARGSELAQSDFAVTASRGDVGTACTCWLGRPDATFGSSVEREACAVHGEHIT